MNIIAAFIAICWVLWIVYLLSSTYTDGLNPKGWLFFGVLFPLLLSIFALFVYYAIDNLMGVL